MSERQQLIYDRLMQALQPTYLLVEDESRQHQSHAGFDQAGSHFVITISSTNLHSVSRVDAHRCIYAALHDLMPRPIHALRINIIANSP